MVLVCECAKNEYQLDVLRIHFYVKACLFTSSFAGFWIFQLKNCEVRGLKNFMALKKYRNNSLSNSFTNTGDSYLFFSEELYS